MRNWKMIGIACAVVLAAARSAMAMEGHESLINVPEARVDTDHTNSDSNYWEHAIVGYVGKPIHLSITYSIGPYAAPDTGGSMTLESNDIPNPEYMYFCPNDETCDLGGALGLSFDFASGTIDGTPTKAGQFKFFPAVRDKDNGEDAYNGDGAWWTTFTKSGGKTWSEAKAPAVIIILPPPGPKRVDLQCTFSTGNLAPLLMTLDFDSGYVEVTGNDGNLAGLYRINNPDSDVIGWSGLPSGIVYTTGGISLNRTNGILTATGMNGAQTAHCDKRSTKRAF
ncbi:MAG: hypothetical protein WCE20_04645 [Rhizomicrobium sp.]